MKKLAAMILLAAACGGGGSKGNTTPLGDPAGGGGDMGSTEGGGGATETTEPAKPVEPPTPPDTGGYKRVAPSELTYTPTREGGPEIAVVHGDPMAGPSALFMKIAPGDKAGVHTHTADYHAVVVSGAPKHWLAGGGKKAKVLAPGSYWFQPGGQAHDDECTGAEPCVLFLIMSGPLDFKAEPKAKAPKVGKYSLTERKNAKFVPLDPTNPGGAKGAFVHGDPKTGPVGFIIELPPGATSVHSHTSDYHLLVLDGAPTHWLPHEKSEGDVAPAGTYWFQPGGYDHGDHCTGDAPCHAFIYMDKALDLIPAATTAK